MPAAYPGGIYSPRTKENKTGVVYKPAKTKILFAEDVSNLDLEVVALETFLRIPTSIPDAPVAGSAYFDAATFTLYVYTGTVWKSILLG